MRKRSYVYIGLCIAGLAMGMTGCSSTQTPPAAQNSTNDETENTTKEEVNEELEMEETADEELETTEDVETEGSVDVDAIKTTQLYDDLFKGMIERIGSIDFDQIVRIAKATNRKIEITEPTDEISGRVSVYDDNGCDVTFVFYPNRAGIESLTLLCYSNELMEASVSNDYHDGDLKFSTFLQTREQKHIEVDSEEDLREFVFVEAPKYVDEYKDSMSGKKEFEVKLDVETVQETNGVSFKIKTNLPDTTELKLTFSGEEYVGQMKVEVEDGIAVSDTFSKSGRAFAKGNYELRVSMSYPRFQSQKVQDAVGMNGELMTGKYVEDDGEGVGKWVCRELKVAIK